MNKPITKSVLYGGRSNNDELTIPEQLRLLANRGQARPAILALSPDGASIEQQLSREELDLQANRIASYLMETGLEPNDPVLLCARRSPNLIAAMVGVLKAGGVFVPIDVDFPARRINQMIEVLGGQPTALVDQIGRKSLSGHNVTPIDIEQTVTRQTEIHTQLPHRSNNDAAYVMFTSGSTGTPKGVTVPQRAIQRLVCGSNFTRFDEQTVSLQMAPLAFDASTLEIWGPLLNGGTCVLYPGGTKPDLDVLETILTRHGITTLWLTASLFNLIVDYRTEILGNVAELLVGGEALSVQHIARAMEVLPDTRLINGYGPTENTTFTCCYRIPRNFDQHASDGIPLGIPVTGTDVQVCDAQGKLVAIGEEGELVASGLGVALGYWGRQDLTEERFPLEPDHEPSEKNPTRHQARRYRTGDRVRIGPDGLVHFLGRIDDQVKLHGHRIELGEIQTLLREQPEVRDAVAIVSEPQPGDRRLLAYVATIKAIDGSTLRERLLTMLPAAIVPAQIVVLDELPLTPAGKIDRLALRAPEQLSTATKATAHNHHEQQIQRIWEQLLGVPSVARHDDFFDLGGTSLRALQFVEEWQKSGETPIPISRMYEGATPARLALTMDGQPLDLGSALESVNPGIELKDERIAIVGMAGRFPGADSVDELWRMLIAGSEGTSFFSDAELDSSVDCKTREDSAYVPARGIVAGIENFDCKRFGISPREATLLDPQQRLLLETAWDTLESAGCDPERYPGSVGVWAGTRTADYLQQILQTRTDVVERSGVFQVTLANDKDFAANRISYLLGLTGPAVAVYSACSTSLVAVHEAARGLLNKECDLALAGGAAITVPQRIGHLHQEGDILSSDGHCRPFDSRASGTLFSDGVAMVALKRLSDAQRDGDQIHAVLLGSAVNNDGGNKASFMAPSPEGQAKVIADAIGRARTPVDSIGYVEAHGTATPLGDPVEVDGLLRVFGRTDTPTCVLGSVKSNVGHLTAAAGVTGLIKAVLSVREGIIPATAQFEKPNPLVDLGGRFLVSNTTETYRPEGPRRACVSSFGVGGTNAHVVIEQPPDLKLETRPGLLKTPLLCFSAPTDEALEKLQERIACFLDSEDNTSIESVVWNLHQSRHRWPKRRTITGIDREQCVAALRSRSASPKTSASETIVDQRDPVFIFPGQGSQFPGMGTGLARHEPLFARHLEVCAEALGTFGDGMTLHSLLDPGVSEHVLQATKHAQPVLFAVEYAMARTWMDLGLRPRWMMGHSVGEFVAACIAGVFSLPDALRLVAARGALMNSMPQGEMLSVRMAPESLQLPTDVDLAAVNGISLCVVAGSTAAIARYADSLTAQDIPHQKIKTSHAFHSRSMEPAVAEFYSVLDSIPMSGDLSVPIISTATGKRLTSELAVSPEYWSRHLRVPVMFADAVNTLVNETNTDLAWIECGPGKGAIASMIRASLPRPKERSDIFISGVNKGNPDSGQSLSENQALTFSSAVGAAWCAGLDVPSSEAIGKYQHISLPTTPFIRSRAWLLDTPSKTQTEVQPGVQATGNKPSLTVIQPTTLPASQTMNTNSTTLESDNTNNLVVKLCDLLSDLSGQECTPEEQQSSFLELGFDSLLLTQTAVAVRKEFTVDVSFRQLTEDFTTPAQLASHLAASGVAIDPPTAPIPQQTQVSQSIPQASIPQVAEFSSTTSGNLMLDVIQQQLLLMQQQLASLKGAEQSVQVPNMASPQTDQGSSKNPSDSEKMAVMKTEPSPGKVTESTVPVKAHGPQLVIKTDRGNRLTARQETHLDQLIGNYSQRTAGSKSYTQEHRSNLADPRTASGFSPRLKEIAYPLIVSSSSGCHLKDIDGNDYVDMLSGFGSNFFGFGASFVREAVAKQMKKGMEIGPQTELAGEASTLFQKLVPSERVAFCNTGSEAVLASLRLARTVTGRDLVVAFTGGYHGIFDEVVTRPTPRGSRPAAPGIPQGSVDNILILPWADEAAIEQIKTRSDDIAAILVEPVQSRDPATQPIEFLKQLRTLSTEIGAALIFDEVVCGFRVAPGGAQQRFGIEADLGTYGKVVGGGMPIGVIAGKRKYMDALDGGFWRYGDDSTPTVGVTYFAGTFVRHPPALAAAIACMKYMLDQGPELQRSVDAKTDQLVNELTDLFQRTAAPVRIDHFSSIMRVNAETSVPYAETLYHHLRYRGVHIQDGRPAFMTTSHSEADLEYIVNAFRDTITDLQTGGFYPEPVHTTDSLSPPEPGARLGRDPAGNPTWYVSDPESPSGYRQVAMAG